MMRDLALRTRVHLLWKIALPAAAIGAGLWLAQPAISRMAPSVSSSTDTASDGAKLYAANCASCHGANYNGGAFGPSLAGPGFRQKWHSLEELTTFIQTSMPPSQPGLLSGAAYRQVAALLLGEQAAAPPPSAGTGAKEKEDAIYSGFSPGRDIGPTRSPPGTFDDGYVKRKQEERARLLSGLSPVTASMLSQPAAKDWLTWRRTSDARGFSPLDAITSANVGKLGTAWSWSLPIGSNEIAPIVHDGVMFLNSANEVQALDAATGTLLWRYRRTLPDQFAGPAFTTQRSMAIYNDALYVATGDRHVVAISTASGKVLWDTEIVPEAENSPVLSAGPLVAGDKILQGVSLGLACNGGCYIVGLDAKTGQKLWRRDTTAKPGEPGGDSWNNTPPEDRRGGGVWITGSYDAKLDLAYFGTGQTYHLYTLIGNGTKIAKGLYTDSTLALDPNTGKIVWYHQHLPGDVWDMDEVYERTLVDLPKDGKTSELLVTVGKLGILDALDRKTGAYAFSIDLGLQNIVASIDPVTGERKMRPDMTPRPNTPLFMCPSIEGVRGWMAGAYNPNSHIMFLPVMEACQFLTWKPFPEGKTAAERIDLASSLRPMPGSDGNYGRVDAIDLVTRKPLWSQRRRAPPMSSILATAGGVLFVGDQDRNFEAIDQRTGKTLWHVRLNAIPNATPITYEAGGRQYVAVVTGGGGPHDIEIREMTPEITNASSTTTLWVFALPKDR